MKFEDLRKFLRNKQFKTTKDDYNDYILEAFNKRNLDIWEGKNRVIVAKEYKSKEEFSEWQNDQDNILILLREINYRLKNNIYFFLFLSSDINIDDKFYWEANTIERDTNICKKYIIYSDEDLIRIPFLDIDTISNNELFKYEDKFREKLKHISNISPTVMKAIDIYFNGNSENISIESVWGEE